MKKNLLSAFIILLLIGCNNSNKVNNIYQDVTNYPQLFMPEVLDSAKNYRDITFNGDLSHFYFTEIVDTNFRILSSEFKNGRWTKPQAAMFSKTNNNFEAKLSFDSKELFFVSDRPTPVKEKLVNDFDIWKARRKNNIWSEPELLSEKINTDRMEYFPTLTKTGKLYFGRNNKAMTRGDIYFAELKNGEYTDTIKLSADLNLPTTSFNAFISPDEDYIIFSTYVKGNNGYHSDLFISYNTEGKWSKPKNLGAKINSEGLDHSPYVTNDGKLFFFSSTRKKMNNKNKFGDHNIFVMKADFIRQK